MKKLSFLLGFVSLMGSGCGWLLGVASDVDKHVDAAPQSAMPQAAFRDQALEAKLTQLFKARMDNYNSEPGAFKVSYAYAAEPWDDVTRNEEIKDKDGNVIATTENQILTGRRLNVWITGRTKTGNCGAVQGHVAFDVHGAKMDSTPYDIGISDSTDPLKFPCRR